MCGTLYLQDHYWVVPDIIYAPGLLTVPSLELQLLNTVLLELAIQVKVLGLWWDTQSDLMRIQSITKTRCFPHFCCHYQELKWASIIFDPLGLISPVIITTKLFLQNCIGTLS